MTDRERSVLMYIALAAVALVFYAAVVFTN